MKFMHTFVKRLLAAVLIFALTVPICTEVVKIRDRQAVLAAIAQQTAYPDGFAESEFAARTDALRALVQKSGLSEDADFSEKVKTAFTEMYHLAAELLAGGDAQIAERFTKVEPRDYARIIAARDAALAKGVEQTELTTIMMEAARG